MGRWGDGEMGRWGDGEMGRWGDGEMGRWGDGEMGRWGDGEMGRWGDGEMGRWGDGEMGRWGDAVRKRDCLMAVNSFPVSPFLLFPYLRVSLLFPRVPVSPCPRVFFKRASNKFDFAQLLTNYL